MKMNGFTAVSPDPALRFVFAVFAILTWLSTLFRLPYDALISAGILQLCLGAAAFAGGRLNLGNGDPHGSIDLILSAILGFASGLTHIVQAAAALAHLSFHPWVYSVVVLMGSLYMACFLPLMVCMPAYVFFEHLSVCAGLLFKALSVLLAMPVLGNIGAWLLFAFALLSLYQGVSALYGQYGRALPQGPALFH